MSLITLPTEILDQVIFGLDYPSLANLGACNRALRASIRPEHVRHALILFECHPSHRLHLPMQIPGPSSAYTWARRRTCLASIPAIPWPVTPNPDSNCAQSYFFPCYTCLRLRKLSSFGSRQIRKDRIINGSAKEQRICIDCQTAKMPDFFGSTRMADGAVCYTCYICKSPARKTKDMPKEEWLARHCQECWAQKRVKDTKGRKRASMKFGTGRTRVE